MIFFIIFITALFSSVILIFREMMKYSKEGVFPIHLNSLTIRETGGEVKIEGSSWMPSSKEFRVEFRTFDPDYMIVEFFDGKTKVMPFDSSEICNFESKKFIHELANQLDMDEEELMSHCTATRIALAIWRNFVWIRFAQ